MAETILPPNATALEVALDLQAGRISDLPVLHDTAINPMTCPEELLPWLAWVPSVDVWDTTWSVDRQREVVSAALRIHRGKGTPGAVEEALKAVKAAAKVIEWFDYPGAPGDPSHFRVDVEIGDRGLTEEETDGPADPDRPEFQERAVPFGPSDDLPDFRGRRSEYRGRRRVRLRHHD